MFSRVLLFRYLAEVWGERPGAAAVLVSQITDLLLRPVRHIPPPGWNNKAKLVGSENEGK